MFIQGIPEEMTEDEIVPTLLMGRCTKGQRVDEFFLPWGSAHVVGRNFLTHYCPTTGMELYSGQGHIKFSCADVAQRYIHHMAGSTIYTARTDRPRPRQLIVQWSRDDLEHRSGINYPSDPRGLAEPRWFQEAWAIGGNIPMRVPSAFERIRVLHPNQVGMHREPRPEELSPRQMPAAARSRRAPAEERISGAERRRRALRQERSLAETADSAQVQWF